MKKTTLLRGIVTPAIIILITFFAVFYFYGLEYYCNQHQISSTCYFSISNAFAHICEVINLFCLLVIPIVVPWLICFSKVNLNRSKYIFYLLMVGGMVLCVWILGSLYSWLDSIPENYTGSIHMYSFHFSSLLEHAIFFYAIVFFALMPWLVLECTRSIPYRLWIFFLCTVATIACLIISPLSDNQKTGYSVFIGILFASFIFIYNFVVLGCDVIFQRLGQCSKLKFFGEKICESTGRCMGETVADIYGIDKATYNNNVSHTPQHLLLHILLPLANIPVQKAVMAYSKHIHSVTYYFSMSAEQRIYDTLVVYLILLLLAVIYLKCTGCKVKTILYYAVLGIVPCILTALFMDWAELEDYKSKFYLDFDSN